MTPDELEKHGLRVKVVDYDDAEMVAKFVDHVAACLEPTAPADVAQAARVLLDDRAAFDKMVYVGEDIYQTGVSFNRVFGDALRAIAGETP